jgi:chemotaxis protein methyltransferase WspC
VTKDRLEQLLRDRIGLAADSIGRLALQHAVESRRAAIHAADYASYVEIAAASLAEWDELVELLVVPETWFFRGSATYEFLGNFARDARHRWRPGAPLRILSAPCSTGEEPYSIVMTLLAAGWPLESFQVEGIDLSRRALSAAATAAYSGRAFRETTPLASTCRARHFRPEGSAEWLEPRIRDAVRWRQANLTNPIFLPDAAPFDVVFCRNVLIYLHEEARQRVRDNLHRVLRPGGLLFLGHADPLSREETRFESLAPAAAFVFRRRESSAMSPTPGPSSLATFPSTKSSAPPAPHLARPTPLSEPSFNDQLAALLKGGSVGPPATVRPVAPRTVAPRTVAVTSTAAPGPQRSSLGNAAPTENMGAGLDWLIEAKRAADRGDMKAAESHCREQLKGSSASAAAYCLLGVILQATGRLEEAQSQFERAVYLDPDHLESLTHLMLAARQAGASADADRYQRRVEKAQRRAATATTGAMETAERGRGAAGSRVAKRPTAEGRNLEGGSR